MSDEAVSTDALQEVKAAAAADALNITNAVNSVTDTDAVSAQLFETAKAIVDSNYRTISKLCDTVEALVQKK